MRCYYPTFCLLMLLCSFSQLFGQREVVLPAHTPLSLTTVEEAVALEVQSGDLVTLRVVLDVKVDGELIIRNGAFAQAQVRYLYTDARRKKPVLLLVPIIVQTVNGTLVPLYGDGLIFGGKGKYSRPVLPTSSTVNAAIHYATKLFFK